MGLTYAHRKFAEARDSQTPITAAVPATDTASTAATVAVTEIWTTRDERLLEGQFEISNERGGVAPGVRMEQVEGEGEGEEAG